MLQWLADVLLLATIAFVAYVICLGVNRQTNAKLILYVAVMLFLLRTIQDLAPTIKSAQDNAKALEQRVDKVQRSIDTFNSKLEGGEKILEFGSPNLQGQEWVKGKK
jgi:predicted Co/Zn/Cd cation transporter (cation efflux family)